MEFKTIIPYVDLKVGDLGSVKQKANVQIVGYIIDKTEITRKGDIIEHPEIIIENERINKFYDFKVKYASKYKYQIRVISLMTLVATDDETGEVGVVKSLISSRPSSPLYITCEEAEAPRPPVDVGFAWNYSQDNLMVHWNFPVNRQRDVRKFQVFRRKSINEPFELMKVYDFNDSQVIFDDLERPASNVVEYRTSSKTFWIDDEFTRSSKYIYAVTCVDVHGFSSSLSDQFEITFNTFKNKLEKSLVCHSGSPKQYPNLYLNNDLFIDAMKVSGKFSKKMKLYFNPSFYEVIDDNNRIKKVIRSTQEGTTYKLQILNLDNQKSATIDVNIDDRRTKQLDDDKNQQLGEQRRLNSVE